MGYGLQIILPAPPRGRCAKIVGSILAKTTTTNDADIRQALLDHQVILFHDAASAAAQHLALAARFGALNVQNSRRHGRLIPEIIEVRKVRHRRRIRRQLHSDVSYSKRRRGLAPIRPANSGLLVRATLFASFSLAYGDYCHLNSSDASRF